MAHWRLTSKFSQNRVCVSQIWSEVTTVSIFTLFDSWLHTWLALPEGACWALNIPGKHMVDADIHMEGHTVFRLVLRPAVVSHSSL